MTVDKLLMSGLFLVLFSGVVFAQYGCQAYVDIAQQQLSPPYPNYFAAAQEYWNAAQCYESQGSAIAAGQNYQRAADYFVQAAAFLVDIGDAAVKALSYERAADAYLKVENTALAVEFYEKARESYIDLEETEKATIVSAKLEEAKDLSEGPKAGIYLTGLFTNIGGGMSIISLILSVGLILYFLRDLIQKPRAVPATYKQRRRDFSYKEPSVPKIETTKREEPPKPPLRAEPRIDPKEKLARKLREKYMPK